MHQLYHAYLAHVSYQYNLFEMYLQQLVFQDKLKNLSFEEKTIFNNYKDIDTNKLSLLINHGGKNQVPQNTKRIKSIIGWKKLGPLVWKGGGRGKM